MKLKITLILALIGTQSFAQNVWNNSTIETNTTSGNVNIGGSNTTSRLYINNSTTGFGIYNNNTGALNATQYGIYNNLSTGAGTGAKYGIYSVLSGSSTNKFGVYTSVTNTGSSNSSTTPTSYGIYARGTGNDTRAGYFQGDVEYSSSNSIFSAGNGTKTLLFGNAWDPTDNGFSISINQTNNAYDWDFANSFILNRGGEMIKRINSANKAFSIFRFGQGDVFRVYGDGKVYATTVFIKLASQFPDYVFTPDYELMPLKEVKEYISKNGHLPNIVNASTVEQDGLDLGSISVKLVETVEELTLYVIQLNEKIEKLESENEKLKKGN